MSQPKIRLALEKRLAAMTPAIKIAGENSKFAPVAGTEYQKANLLPAAPDNSTQGSGYFREQGVFQVTLCYPENSGTAAIGARAEAIKAWFKRGSTFTESGVNVRVDRTPEVGPGRQNGDRYCVPVSIRYSADIFT